MVLLYRAMCEEEFKGVSKDTPFSWKSRRKFFSKDIDFIKHRVLDGVFNNSRHYKDRYTQLVVYEVESTIGFSDVSDKELMLYRQNEPLVKVLNITKIKNFAELKTLKPIGE